MPKLAEPEANRLRKPSWKDGRLLAGLALVLLATALGGFALSAADTRVPVYAARDSLLPGQILDPGRLVRVDVQLADAKDVYLAAADGLPADGYVLREIRPGELVPRAAIGTRTDVSVQPVAVAVDGAWASALVAGSVVDVYANRPTGESGAQRYEGPDRVAAAVPVATVSSGGSGLGGSSARSAVQLLIPTGQVRSLIGLIDAGAKITLVPVPGSVVKGSS